MKLLTKSLRFLLIVPLISTFFFSLAPNSADATIVTRLNILELTVKSNKIIEGTIASIRTVALTGKLAYTEITMNVSETLRGVHSPTAVFKVPGGKLPDGTRLCIVGTPNFRKGEQAIVFLEGKNSDIVTGFSQGRFGIENSNGESFATQNTKGLCMLDAKGPEAGEPGGPVTNWPLKFSSQLTKSTSQLKASQSQGMNGEFIHGGILQVPLKVFKATVSECNPDNYTSSDN